MLKILITNTIILFCFNITLGQDCPVINENGSFENLIYIPGGEPSMGITTGQIDNWEASHGTVDYVTSEWNWYGMDGLVSNAGHMCYGNRTAHDHSEGMFTSAKIYGDDDLLYTLKLDYATVCEAANNGFLNIALNNNLQSDDFNYFQYPTAEVFPEVFQDIQPVDRFELTPDVNLVNGEFSKYEIAFVPSKDYEQIWFFTEYQYEDEEIINCGIMIDDVELTATTSALIGINVDDDSGSYLLTPKCTKELDIVSYNWTINQTTVSSSEDLSYDFKAELYTVCLDIVDARKACGSTCIELDLSEIAEENTSDESCTYCACLDAGGLPNLVGFQYLTSDGQVVELDENTEGFFFPYCDGTSGMCDGSESEIGLFLEDLNTYFTNNGINAIAKTGDEEDVMDSFCRSTAFTIESADIIPLSFFIDDFSSNQALITIAEFQFNPNNCSSAFEDKEDDQFNALVDNEIEPMYDVVFEKVTYSIQPIVFENNLILKAEIEIEDTLVSFGGIYNTAGQLVVPLESYRQGDDINLSGLPDGMYAINLVNKKYQQSGLFFVGSK